MLSRDEVQVVLRDRTSISPDWSAVKRFLASSATNFTFLASPSTAAAMARHTSTSSPVHWPLSSGMPKPARPVLAPQVSVPLPFTVSSVPAEAAAPDRPNAQVASSPASALIASFMSSPIR